MSSPETNPNTNDEVGITSKSLRRKASELGCRAGGSAVQADMLKVSVAAVAMAVTRSVQRLFGCEFDRWTTDLLRLAGVGW